MAGVTTVKICKFLRNGMHNGGSLSLFGKGWITVFLLFMVVFTIPGLAQTPYTNVSCVDNRTAILNVVINATTDGDSQTVGLQQTIRCPYGCNNATGGSNDCNPDPTDSFMWQGITVAIMTALIGFCVFMAWWGAKDNKVEMMFLFIMGGFVSLLIDLGLVRGILIASSAAPIIITLVDDAIILFAFIFVVFFGYFIINYIKGLFEAREAKKQQNFRGKY